MIKCKQQIAILLATYNGEQFLTEQLESILNQTFSDWHLYIHDDASIDNTLAIVKEYKENNSDKITILEYPTQGGACNNFFSLLESVDASYYMFSDQDDVWNEHKIHRTYDEMKRLEQKYTNTPVIVHSDLAVVDSRLKVIDSSFIRNQKIKVDKVREFEDYAYTNTVTGCTMMVNAEALKCIKYPRHAARMHDSWIAMSVAASGGIVHFINEPLLQYRQHDNNTLGAKEIDKINLLSKLHNIIQIIGEILGHYREMNAIRPISFINYLMARIRYKYL